MKILTKSLFLLAMVSTFVFTACNDDDDEAVTNPIENGASVTSVSKKTLLIVILSLTGNLPTLWLCDPRLREDDEK